MSSAPTAKLEPTKTKEADPAQASKPVKQAPALLEEDDEFEDFPVEGKKPQCDSKSRQAKDESTYADGVMRQIGHKKTQRSQAELLTCGRRAGMTMTRMTTSQKL